MIGGCFITDCQKKGLGVNAKDLTKYLVSVLQWTSHWVVQVIHNLDKWHFQKYSGNYFSKYTWGEISVKDCSVPASAKSISEGKTWKKQECFSAVKNTLDNHLAISYIEFLYYIIYSYVEFLPHALPAQVCWSCCCQAHCQCCFVLRKKMMNLSLICL